MSENDVIVIGAGLAGLCCARHLHANGIAVTVLEASDGVGGRARTDRVDGFLLDRGFQVLLTAYPEARRMLDYDALDLKAFYPGALVRAGGAFHRIADPWRRPLDAVGALLAPLATPRDGFRLLGLRRRLARTSFEALWQRPEVSTASLLESEGFGTRFRERFFRPFYGGVFLDRELATSSRMFEFTFKMFAEGDTAVPAAGMGAMAEQLASKLPPGTVRLRMPVRTVTDLGVVLGSGETLGARCVVIATDGETAQELLRSPGGGAAGPVAGSIAFPGWMSTTTIYFDAPAPPVREGILVLDGDGTGPVNHLCVPSNVAPAYAPAGRALVSASTVGVPALADEALLEAVRAQMRGWFGDQVDAWRHLRTYRIPRALPRQVVASGAPSVLATPQRPVEVRSGLFVCGDHRDNGSINGAMESGRRAAEALMRVRGAK